MWVYNHAEGTARLYEPWMAETVDDPVADLPGETRGVVFERPTQIVAAVGEQLVERYESIEPYER